MTGVRKLSPEHEADLLANCKRKLELRRELKGLSLRAMSKRHGICESTVRLYERRARGTGA